MHINAFITQVTKFFRRPMISSISWKASTFAIVYANH